MRLTRPSPPQTLQTRALLHRWGLHLLEFGLFALALWGTQILSVYLWLLPNGDVDEYHQYALDFWTLRPIFHHLPVEYPPLAILAFTLTLLPPLPLYHAVFAAWMGAFVLLGYAGIQRNAGRLRATVYALYLLLGTAATLLARFDVVPALITLAALWATERRRFGYAYILLALGTLLKLYPIFLIPVVILAHWYAAGDAARHMEGGGSPELDPRAEAPRSLQRRVTILLRSFVQRYETRRVTRGVALYIGLVALGFTGALLFSPEGALSNLLYAQQRPIQVESTPASILWLGTLIGIPAHPEYSFVSLNYAGALDGAVKLLSLVALVGGCLWVYWHGLRARISTGRAFAAVLCVVLVTNKLFSPQYLIWVLPVIAYVVGVDLIWIAICVLTWLDFPIIYQLHHPIQAVTYSATFMPVLALRNGLLLWATLRVIIRPEPAHMGSAQGTANTIPIAEEQSRQMGDTEAPPRLHDDQRDERGGAPALSSR